MTKLFLKNSQGIRDILHLLNLIDDHNPSFYERTVNYMTKVHPPFDSSWIYYHPEKNLFNFIGRDSKKIGRLLTDVLPTSWKNYNPYSPYWVHEDTFSYLSIEPHIVLVSNAGWLMNRSDIKQMAFDYYAYIKAHVAKEREIFKAMMEPDEVKSKQLF